MKKLLITGGVGFLGYHICKKLSKKFDEIILVDIDTFNPIEYDKNVSYFRVDVTDKDGLRRVIQEKKPNFIIHTAAALPLCKKERIWKVNLKGMKNILELALENKVERVTQISSTAVYGVPKIHPLYEKSPLIGVGPYGKTKIISEKICEAYRKKGLCVPIIRPKTFIGTGRLGVFQILYDWIENGSRIPIIGNGKNRYQLLEVEDLVDAIYLTLTKDKEKANDTFNVGATSFNTVYEDVSALCKYANSGSKVLKTPALPIKIILSVLEFMRLSPLYKWVYGTADKDSFVSVEKIRKVLGWSPKYSNAQALINSYKWYLDNKSSMASGTGVTHRIAWKQGALGIFKKIL
jgi:nucleoside-diphosphate-sugar epimerase